MYAQRSTGGLPAKERHFAAQPIPMILELGLVTEVLSQLDDAENANEYIPFLWRLATNGVQKRRCGAARPSVRKKY
jgi:hypothetical protein